MNPNLAPVAATLLAGDGALFNFKLPPVVGASRAAVPFGSRGAKAATGDAGVRRAEEMFREGLAPRR